MPRISFPEMEENLVQHWKSEKIFERSVQERPEDNQFVFYDGPPFATGMPHYGHILASTLKDVMPRYATMQGYRVERRWGWDCHGLPIENLIEKELGLSTKQDIEEMGVAKFNDACRNNVLTYAKEWKVIIDRLGRWVDMENDYKTMDTSYSESIWWAFKELHTKGLIYQGHKAMHVCPRCETTLSNFEVTQGYKDVSDPSVIWKFKLVDEDAYLLAWTTTPWSSPGITGLSIKPDAEYLKVKTDNGVVIFAKERLEFVIGDMEHEVLETVQGSDLVGSAYEPVFPEYKEHDQVKENDNVYKVYAADYVELDAGTGIVTINGAYGDIDMQACANNGLPILVDVDMNGHFNELAGVYAGGHVKETEQKLIADKEKEGLVWRAEQYFHSYPHCWRCDTPLLNYAASSWFVKVTDIKDRMLEHNATINWTPNHIKDGRFGKWLEGARDWAISRDRYWGAPLPVWQSEDGDTIVVGSLEELKELSGVELTDVHKEFVDDVTIKKDGKEYTRVSQVLDCWFESGSMPYAQEHYPFENKDRFDNTFPANYIAEGLDQTRGWFYTLTVLSTALFDKPAFKNVIVNGMVLAEDGKKMSKRLKNYPEPGLVMEKYGADALRFYLMNSPVVAGADLRFSEKGVDQVMKRVILTLWNVFSFYQMFAETTEVPDTPQSDDVMDTWVLAYMEDVVATVTEAMETYQLQVATRTLEAAVQEVSTWYLRRSRDRFKGTDEQRVAAMSSLRHVLLTLTKLLAPFMPFITERIYMDMNGEADSIHLAAWPESTPELANPELLEQMSQLRQYVEQTLAAREAASLKVRQPLASVTLPKAAALPEELFAVLAEEVNVKQVLVEDVKEVVLDTEITPELAQEGMYRELVRAINNMRKKQGLTIHDTAQVVYSTDSELVKSVFTDMAEQVTAKVRASECVAGDTTTETTQEVKLNGEMVTLTLVKQ